ncbi:MAG: Rid family detoxifying hydrolase [Elusimicrobia bacterium]|nr:Rid family detoxifying hydrolase [Elusimicrobiota bacterium]MDE2425348.1 Rid family detoxifying hydrolase [Elusimicrobiota bacterium]
MKVSVASGKVPQAIGPYSQAIDVGALVFVSGQIPAGPDGALVEGGIAAQTERCLDNVEAVLEAAGLTLADVVKTTVFMADLAQFKAMNEAYARRFPAPYPARAAVQVAALPKGASIEIEAIAVRR